jgi:small neutral amino acid transporter SnatA (MarC family)
MFNIDLSLNVEAESAAAHVEQWVNNVLVLGGFLLGAMSWWIALTSIINIFRKGFKPRHMLAINRIAGIVICALGIITLISVIIS